MSRRRSVSVLGLLDSASWLLKLNMWRAMAEPNSSAKSVKLHERVAARFKGARGIIEKGQLRNRSGHAKRQRKITLHYSAFT